MKVKIKRKEILATAILCTLIILLFIYINIQSINQHAERAYLLSTKSDSSNQYSFGSETQQSLKLISETIKGEIDRGAFENVINKLEILTEAVGGYVKTLRLTYQDQAWSGLMICKVPSSNVTSFTFNARAIIDDNGTVTYVNINVDYLVETQQGENASYSTITFDLAETKPEGKFELGVSLGPILSILSTSLWWIFQGIVVGLPLCFVSLGVVILISRGLVPLWKSMLKKNKIMLPKLAIHKSVNKWKLFVVAATFVQVIAFCLPWLSRRYLYFFWEPFPIISEPTAPKELWLWSFMAVVNTVVGESKVLIFGDYWFNNRMENVNWLFLLMFQVFTIAVGLIAVKRSVSKKWAYSILLSLLSLGAPILCVYQRNAQLNFFYIKSEFFLGFWIALVSSVLYIVSVWLGKDRTKA